MFGLNKGFHYSTPTLHIFQHLILWFAASAFFNVVTLEFTALIYKISSQIIFWRSSFYLLFRDHCTKSTNPLIHSCFFSISERSHACVTRYCNNIPTLEDKWCSPCKSETWQNKNIDRISEDVSWELHYSLVRGDWVSVNVFQGKAPAFQISPH